MPRRSPRPSSPTSATKVMVPGVTTPASFSARITPSITASPRQSSPMPGPRSSVPSRFTCTSVPSGNTVSRCAANTSRGRSAAPGRSPMTLPTSSTRTCCRPSASNAWRTASPRAVSLKGGAGISHNRTCSSIICGSFVLAAASAACTAGCFEQGGPRIRRVLLGHGRRGEQQAAECSNDDAHERRSLGRVPVAPPIRTAPAHGPREWSWTSRSGPRLRGLSTRAPRAVKPDAADSRRGAARSNTSCHGIQCARTF